VKLTVHLYNAQQAVTALRGLFEQIKPWLVAGWRIKITAEQETRSVDQNAKLHAELAEVAATVEWAGKKRDTEVWKRLMTAAWLRARGESVEVLPAIDGHGIDVVFRRTSSLTKAECSELLEFVLAWKAEHMEQTA
jgi:predicted phage tail protein